MPVGRLAVFTALLTTATPAAVSVLMVNQKPRTAYVVLVDGAALGPRPWSTWDSGTRLELLLPPGHHIVRVIEYDDTVVTGTTPPRPIPAVRVYPNPTDGSLRVESAITGDWNLYDVTGRHVYRCRITGGSYARVQLDLPAGAYFWKLGTTSGKVTVLR